MVSKLSIQQIVNDPEWQSIRKAMVGTWKRNQVRNCEVLRTYLGDFSDPLKVRRVHNYLTGSGFRIGIISHPEIDKIVNEIKKHKNER